MGNNNFIKPYARIKPRDAGRPKMRSSHHAPPRSPKTPSHHRTPHPDEGQTDATTVDPAFIFPDGSVNCWASLTAIPQPDEIKEPEPDQADQEDK